MNNLSISKFHIYAQVIIKAEGSTILFYFFEGRSNHFYFFWYKFLSTVVAIKNIFKKYKT